MVDKSSPDRGPTTGEFAPVRTATVSLVVCTPDGTPFTVPVVPGRTYTIGRRPSSDIYLEFPWVSLDHAILYGGDPPHIVDLGSRNGTAVGVRLLPTGTRVALEHRSVLSIGAITILVQRLGMKHTPAPVAAPVSIGSGAPPTVPPVGAPPGAARKVRGSRPPDAEVVVTQDPAMKELFALAERVAASTVSVLILGETGVGKELLAKAIHDNSSRSENRLVTLNCAAIPENLVESELFGFERGAFSGAVSPKPGLFEAANRSTLFLDEVGELPKAVQAKLLRVLETGEVSRLGSVKTARVDVRIVAATNRDIQAEIAAGAFRSDLFYRLNGMTVKIPPLRERLDDIAALADHFAARVSHEGVVTITNEALTILKKYPWPGNVRELRSVVERAMLLAQGQALEPKHLMFDPPATSNLASRRISKAAPAPISSTQLPPEDTVSFSREERPTGAVAAELKAELAMREQRRIRSALERAGGNQTDAAKLLGISRRTLINRIEQYGIARPRKRRDTPSDV